MSCSRLPWTQSWTQIANISHGREMYRKIMSDDYGQSSCFLLQTAGIFLGIASLMVKSEGDSCLAVGLLFL